MYPKRSQFKYGIILTLLTLINCSKKTDNTHDAPNELDKAVASVIAEANSLSSSGRQIALGKIVTGPGNIDGTGTAARFAWPEGLAVDAAGNVYVADTVNCTIRKITPSGVVTTQAGNSDSEDGHKGGSKDGIGRAAQFKLPQHLAVDTSGNLYVADTYNHAIRKITPTGEVTTLAGSAMDKGGAQDGVGADARFDFPSGISVDPSGHLFVTDNIGTIRKISPAGSVTTLAGIYWREESKDGKGSEAGFDSPKGSALDAYGNIYVADSNHTIRKISRTGVTSTIAGSPGKEGSQDGKGHSARFKTPAGVAIDSKGIIYVADSGNSTIRKISPTGIVSTLAGTVGMPGYQDGTGKDARFNSPEGVAVDASGNVYVADTFNHTIRKITPADVVTTLAGSPWKQEIKVDGVE